MNDELLNNNNNTQYVCFELNEQNFGVRVEFIIEVLPVPDITPVVHTPNFIRGVINLRGEIKAIIDLKNFFNLEQTEISEKSKIVVIQYEEKSCGFIVDSVSHIENCEKINNDTIPETIPDNIAAFLEGVTLVKNKPLMILNLQAILNSSDLKQFE